VPYFHVVFTLPSRIGNIAYQNKAVVYDLLFKAAAETMHTIAADPKHLGAPLLSSLPPLIREPIQTVGREALDKKTSTSGVQL
jgi:hypothetical protein